MGLTPEAIFAKVMKVLFYIGLAVAGTGIFININLSYVGLFILSITPLAGLAASLLKATGNLKILIFVVICELIGVLVLAFSELGLEH